MSKPVTRTVFRKWRNGDIIALFPYEVADPHGNCVSYEHDGQHGAAGYLHVMAATKPAKESEYAELKRELESIGYSVQVVKRRSYK